jgi:hypothetical protein
MVQDDFNPDPEEPPPNECWFFSPPPENGVLCVIIDKPWPPNAIVTITARAHDSVTDTGGYDLDGPTIRLIGQGTPLQCAEKLADVLRCAFLQQAGVHIDVTVEEIAPGKVKITVKIPGGFIDRGILVICVQPQPDPPVIDGFTPATAGPGETITIVGRGFGNCPDNLCAVVVEDAGTPSGGGAAMGQRFIPLRVLDVGPNHVRAQLGPIPMDGRPGHIMIGLGRGEQGRFQPAIPDIVLERPVWVWHGIHPGGMAQQPFQPRPQPPPPNQCWFFSPPPQNGVICVYLDPNKPWPPEAVISIIARAHDSVSGAGGNDLDGPTIRFLGGGSTLECADRIADVLRCAFRQQAGVEVEVMIEQLADGRVKITVSIPGGFIDRGMLTICIDSGAPGVP